MKKLFALLMFAASLVAVGSSAHAADLERTRTLVWSDLTSTFNARYEEPDSGKTFLENYTFTIDSSSSVSSAVVSIALDGVSRVGIDSFTLTSSTGQIWTGTSVLDGDVQTLTLRVNGLSAGDYTLSVAGSVLGSNGGSFAGNISIAPVPEASTTAMMLGGLALVGFVATRRRRNAGAAPRLQGSHMMVA